MNERVEIAEDGISQPHLRCRILAIAERLFREIGYRKTTVTDIGDALGMSPGNVYRFFPSKKALNEAVAEKLLGDIASTLRGIAAQTDLTASDRFRRMVTTKYAMSSAQFVGDHRMHDMVEAAMEESWEVVHRHIDTIDEIFCDLVRNGVEAGEFKAADPIVAARCIQAAIVRFCHPALIAQCANEVGPTIDQMIDFLLAGLGAKP